MQLLTSILSQTLLLFIVLKVIFLDTVAEGILCLFSLMNRQDLILQGIDGCIKLFLYSHCIPQIENEQYTQYVDKCTHDYLAVCNKNIG